MVIGWKAASLLALALTGSAVWAQGVMLGPGPSPDSGPGVQTSPQRSAVGVADAEEAQLRARVLARWEALIKGDFEAAYQFETPAYRAIYTLSQFRTQFGNQTRWIMADIKEIRYDDSNVAKIRVEVAYRYAEPAKNGEVVDMTHEVDEIWLRKEEQWWRQQS
jgi:hypothetical protein